MIYYSNAIQDKYLDFFTGEEAKTVERPNAIMDEFCYDMSKIAESISSGVSPTEVILQVFERNKALFEKKDNPSGFEKIVILVNSNNLHNLSEFELFTLLWYCSCKNVIAYQEAYYVAMTNNGINGKLLHTLHDFQRVHTAAQAAIKDGRK